VGGPRLVFHAPRSDGPTIGQSKGGGGAPGWGNGTLTTPIVNHDSGAGRAKKGAVMAVPGKAGLYSLTCRSSKSNTSRKNSGDRLKKKTRRALKENKLFLPPQGGKKWHDLCQNTYGQKTQGKAGPAAGGAKGCIRDLVGGGTPIPSGRGAHPIVGTKSSEKPNRAVPFHGRLECKVSLCGFKKTKGTVKSGLWGARGGVVRD